MKSINLFLKFQDVLPFPPTLLLHLELTLTQNVDDDRRIDLIFNQPYSQDQDLDIGGHVCRQLKVEQGKASVPSFQVQYSVFKVLTDTCGKEGLLMLRVNLFVENHLQVEDFQFLG